jgi:hypothetical protein
MYCISNPMLEIDSKGIRNGLKEVVLVFLYTFYIQCYSECGAATLRWILKQLHHKKMFA